MNPDTLGLHALGEDISQGIFSSFLTLKKCSSFFTSGCKLAQASLVSKQHRGLQYNAFCVLQGHEYMRELAG